MKHQTNENYYKINKPILDCLTPFELKVWQMFDEQDLPLVRIAHIHGSTIEDVSLRINKIIDKVYYYNHPRQPLSANDLEIKTQSEAVAVLNKERKEREESLTVGAVIVDAGVLKLRNNVTQSIYL